MRKVFSDHAWEDYLYWQKYDKKILKKINDLMKDIERFLRIPIAQEGQTKPFT
tara:strand:- start:582 stop:740 length:159 start_codon:yes stop_codon:yes gene_type:complete